MPTATVVVPEDQLSLAIGRNGQNARLAAKLSGWRIDIKGLFEAVSDTLFRIQNDPRYTQYQELEAGTIHRIETILEKKNEGRPISPEEYRELHLFNSRVESGLIEERREITKQQQARIQAARAVVPDDAYDLPIMTLGLPTKVENLLDEAGLTNVGELAYRLLLVPSSISDIDGIGPTYVQQIEDALEIMIGYEPLSEEFDIDEELILPGTTTAVEEEPDKEESSEVEADLSTEDGEEETPEVKEEAPETEEEEASETEEEEIPETEEEEVPETEEEEIPETEEEETLDTEEKEVPEAEEEEAPEPDQVEPPDGEEETSEDEELDNADEEVESEE
jgi:N utilization substance protein A